MRMEPPVQPEILSEIKLSDLRFREVSYPQNYRMAPHRHSEAHVFLCLAGEVVHSSVGGIHHLSKSSVGYVPLDDSHSDQFLGHVRTFDIVLGERFLSAIPNRDSGKTFCVLGRPARWALEAYREFKSPDEFTPLSLEAISTELGVQICREAGRCTEMQTPRWLSRAREILHDEFRSLPSLERIAKEVGVHPSHLTRTFRQRYKCSIGEYLRQLRIDRACQLLEQGEMSIGEISLRVGFSDQSQFSRAFKKHTGTSPIVYRGDRVERLLKPKQGLAESRGWTQHTLE